MALIDGLDSPALRELVTRALEELAIPAPGTIPPGFVVAASGGVARRPGIDSLRLEVVPVGPTTGQSR